MLNLHFFHLVQLQRNFNTLECCWNAKFDTCVCAHLKPLACISISLLMRHWCEKMFPGGHNVYTTNWRSTYWFSKIVLRCMLSTNYIWEATIKFNPLFFKGGKLTDRSHKFTIWTVLKHNHSPLFFFDVLLLALFSRFLFIQIGNFSAWCQTLNLVCS